MVLFFLSLLTSGFYLLAYTFLPRLMVEYAILEDDMLMRFSDGSCHLSILIKEDPPGPIHINNTFKTH